jgi:hypothetical protein
MISRTESVQNWLENLTMQMCNMVVSFHPLEVLGAQHMSQTYKEQAQKLAGYDLSYVPWWRFAHTLLSVDQSVC